MSENANEAVTAVEAGSTEAKATTVLDVKTEASVAEKAVPQDWPSDWRARVSGGDEKLLKQLDRFNTPTEMYKSYRELQTRMSSTPRAVVLSESSTEDEVTEYRKLYGIPDKAEGYDTSLPDGLVIGENDKELVTNFLGEMHKSNAHPQHVKSALTAYYKILEKQQEEFTQRNAQQRQEVEETLRQEWGTDYKANVNMVRGLLAKMPEDVRDRMAAARFPDNSMVFNDPGVMRWMSSLAREVNPIASVFPTSGENSPQALDTEIAAIENKLKTDRQGYFADKAMQARYAQLIDVRNKIKERA